ncbi:transcriptional regulator [Burkholderia cenocepacia]|uniref:transcriptional regulator n=1 Tax=Burkholderia cenocepacia TaxID=95486 RepID=UPI002010F2CB|nr:transcriptional regulator [Burkholderia cenocepacia]
MPTLEEKAAFSARLKLALQRRSSKPVGATALALQFNLHFCSGSPISPQTAHKWLSGRTIPTQDKLRVLAAWLCVDLHWLHYGPSPSLSVRSVPQPLPRDASYPPTSEMMTLAAKIAALRMSGRYLIEALIDVLYDSAVERDRPGNIRGGSRAVPGNHR